ncbi:hypothetical protein HanRHA438_Chr01g0014551 [Helianthus annuus]|uniref:Uncharacterized protein n=1 Tax=Helianthus annuus TaxID=4232 RepID=A0A9K3JUW0_HELAN|nr:hypothetical protein HanXRQr2_Chr01g0014121 [Helianthus annuus]KAJ0947374.1 hypothetical protein HanRHA438_Chr01g0014551 [Helianthus annuus]
MYLKCMQPTESICSYNICNNIFLGPKVFTVKLKHTKSYPYLILPHTPILQEVVVAFLLSYTCSPAKIELFGNGYP